MWSSSQKFGWQPATRAHSHFSRPERCDVALHARAAFETCSGGVESSESHCASVMSLRSLVGHVMICL
jgi:hypothetical protein